MNTEKNSMDFLKKAIDTEMKSVLLTDAVKQKLSQKMKVPKKVYRRQRVIAWTAVAMLAMFLVYGAISASHEDKTDALIPTKQGQIVHAVETQVAQGYVATVQEARYDGSGIWLIYQVRDTVPLKPVSKTEAAESGEHWYGYNTEWDDDGVPLNDNDQSTDAVWVDMNRPDWQTAEVQSALKSKDDSANAADYACIVGFELTTADGEALGEWHHRNHSAMKDGTVYSYYTPAEGTGLDSVQWTEDETSVLLTVDGLAVGCRVMNGDMAAEDDGDSATLAITLRSTEAK